MTDRILRLPEVSKSCGISRSTIYQGMKDGSFPKSRKLGTRMVGWSEREIEEWIETKLNQREEGGIE